jgi:GDPmannose 4,6-dehydratase
MFSLRFYQASSSEIFGASDVSPQNEHTEYAPATPYGFSKMFATQFCQNMRRSRNLHISCGILYNHESEFRDPKFVSRKITKGLVRIKLKLQDQIELGNLDSHRDWGYAADYVQAMWLMLQQDIPGDFVIASGQQHTVKDFLIETFTLSGLPGKFSDYVKFDQNQLRPQDPNTLVGDSALAKVKLGWEPTTSFRELVQKMYSHDLVEETANL